MNVLIVLKHGRVSGVNTFSRALSILLKKMGFKVYFNIIGEPTRYHNYITEHMYGYYHEGISVMAIFHNYNTLYDRYSKKAPVNIFITHGTQCEEYVPPKTASLVMCLSGQQYDYYKNENKITFPNLIETRKTPFLPAKRKLKRVLLCDLRYGHFYQEKVREACGYLGLEFDYLRQDEVNYGTYDRMSGFDLIIGYGRCIIEALSLGKCVIVYGINGGDGYLNDKDFYLMAYKNFSGYAKKTMLPPPRMEALDFYSEFVKYNYLDGIKMMVRVINEYTIDKEIKVFNEYIKEGNRN